LFIEIVDPEVELINVCNSVNISSILAIMKCAEYARIVRLKKYEDSFLEHPINYEGNLFENPLIPF
jgi:hypothetical protein